MVPTVGRELRHDNTTRGAWRRDLAIEAFAASPSRRPAPFFSTIPFTLPAQYGVLSQPSEGTTMSETTPTDIQEETSTSGTDVGATAKPPAAEPKNSAEANATEGSEGETLAADGASTAPDALAEAVESAPAEAGTDGGSEPANEVVEKEAAVADETSTPSADTASADTASADTASADIVAAAAVEGPEMAALRAAQAANESIKGQVIGWNKGGYHIAVGKIAAFCPVSQIELGNPRAPKRYVDKTFDFRVIEVDPAGKRVVLSRAAALLAQRESQQTVVRGKLEVGAVLEGRVSSITDFGAFVDLGGGIEGLVHVSEISRRRVDHPKEALQKGQPVQVQVLKIEKGGERISLSMKRLEADPWKGVAERFPAGTQFEGTVLRKAEFGLFVEVEPGLEGLVHVSRLPLGANLEHAGFEAGQAITGWVAEVDAKRRRLSLSLREVASGNPWDAVAERYPIGEVVDGTVERLAPFGAFIQLEPGLTGLLPFSHPQHPAGRQPEASVPHRKGGPGDGFEHRQGSEANLPRAGDL